MCGSRNGPFIMRFFLFLFILFLAPDAFCSSSETVVNCGGFVDPNGQTACTELANSLNSPDGAGYNGRSCADAKGAVYVICTTATISCTPSSGEPVDPSLPNGFCDPSTDCYSQTATVIVNGVPQSGGNLTNGQVCAPATSNTSSVPASTTCPSGFSLVAGTNGCECGNGSSYSDSSTASTNSACNGGSATASTLSPVAPVASTVSGGTPSCPSGTAEISSGSSVSCYAVVTSTSGGGGGTSTGGTSSSGSPTGSTGSGSTSGTGSVSGSTGSAGSGTSPTGSTGSDGTFTAPTISFGSSGLQTALQGMNSSFAFGSIGFGNSWLPQSCVSAPTWQVDLPIGGFSQTFTLPTDDLCTLASDLRPFVLAGGVILALMILAW